MGGYLTCRWGRGGDHVPADVRDALGRAACRRDGPARTAEHAREADSRTWAARRCSWASSSRWPSLRGPAVPRDVRRQLRSASGLLLAAAVMFVVFVIDDFRDVSPPAKIAGQVLSGSVLSLFGVTMLYFRVPFASYEYVVLSTDLAPLVTVITVVVLANAVNLIDGIDGLAAGVVLIAAAAIFLYADRLFKAGLLEGSNIAPLVAAITVGVCAGFLPAQLQSRAHHHGRRRRDVARTVPGHDDDHHRWTDHRPVQWSDLLLLRAAAHPARDPRRSHRRRRVRVPAARRATPALRRRRPRASAPSPRADGPWPSSRGRDPVALDGAVVGGRAAADVHRPRQHARRARGSSRSDCSSTSTSIPASAAVGPPRSGAPLSRPRGEPRIRSSSSTEHRRKRASG